MARGETYDEFIKKFEPKRTTDDCFTPPKVYDAVLNFCVAEFGINPDDVVRPFYPDGDYQSFDYNGKVVIDNPPFSILSKIIDFYISNGVKFFLFAPALACLHTAARRGCCMYVCDARITYHNGATVATAFVTNLSDNLIKVSPELRAALAKCKPASKKKKSIHYPPNVISIAKLNYLAVRDIPYILPKEKGRPAKRVGASGYEPYGGAVFVADEYALDIPPIFRDAIKINLSNEDKRLISELNYKAIN